MLHQADGLTLFTFASLPADGIVHAISTRLGGVSRGPYGSLNLSLSVHDDDALVLENRRRFASALGADPSRLVTTQQAHRDDVLFVDDDVALPSPVPRADIQVTDRPGWLLSLRFADCVPVLMVHPQRRVVAAVHAGWRGSLKGASRTAVRVLTERYGAEASGLWVGIGPSIGPCCYEVGEEVACQFADAPDAVMRNGGPRPRLDLWALNRAAVVSSGVPPAHVELAEVCTRCHSDLFFSHRAHGFPAGRFSAVIGLR